MVVGYAVEHQEAILRTVLAFLAEPGDSPAALRAEAERPSHRPSLQAHAPQYVPRGSSLVVGCRPRVLLCRWPGLLVRDGVHATLVGIPSCQHSHGHFHAHFRHPVRHDWLPVQPATYLSDVGRIHVPWPSSRQPLLHVLHLELGADGRDPSTGPQARPVRALVAKVHIRNPGHWLHHRCALQLHHDDHHCLRAGSNSVLYSRNQHLVRAEHSAVQHVGHCVGHCERHVQHRRPLPVGHDFVPARLLRSLPFLDRQQDPPQQVLLLHQPIHHSLVHGLAIRGHQRLHPQLLRPRLRCPVVAPQVPPAPLHQIQLLGVCCSRWWHASSRLHPYLCGLWRKRKPSCFPVGPLVYAQNILS